MMQKKVINVAMGLAFGLTAISAEASLTMTFANGSASAAAPGPCSGIAWTAGSEFRMCNSAGTALADGPKNGMNGGETWTFNDANQLTGVSGTPPNPGTTAGFGGGAAPNPGSNPTLQQNATFFFNPFNFLAPTLGSLAGNAYGPGMYTGGVPVNGTTSLFHFNVLEAQWGGDYFPLGQDGGAGINFTGMISGANTVGNVTTFTYDMFANHTITTAEDPNIAGFSGFTAEWHLQGTGTYVAPVPLPAAVWLLGSGLVGMVGIARRKKTLAT